ncbi:MAG: NAD(P)H-dependent oxidoreductase subunit E [Deltaproteobacteria bacterium]|nr:NAD(P)H-dependent oxidoreductase subunit E [Deltaproteobacteria bacterium]
MAIAVQGSIGFVPAIAIPEIAERSGATHDEIAELVASDAAFRSSPLGRHRVTICTGTSCAPRGGVAMVRIARELLGINLFQTTTDAAIRLDSEKCLGRCASAPNVKIDGKLQGAMDEKRFGSLVGILRRSRDRSSPS